jgi:tetratricopeptide (TPR) repeat protein
MGLAATSLPGTPSSQYFNPALLATQRKKGFEFYRTTLFDSESQFHAAAYVHPSLDWGTLGLTALRLDVGGIEERDEMNLLLSSDLKNSQTRFLLGYAIDVMPMLAAGVNLKVDHQSFGDYNGSAIGLDVGFLYTRSLGGFRWLDNARGALMVENLLEPSVKLDRDDVPDPRRLLMGVSADGRYGDIGYATSLDLVSPKYSPFHARVGQEFTYRGMVAARVGWDGSTATFGVGGMYRKLSLDYAYREEELGSNHRISLSVTLGASLEEERSARRARADAELQKRVRERVTAFERSQLSSLLQSADALFDAGEFEKAREKYGMALMWDSENERASSRLEQCRVEEAVGRAETKLDGGDYVAALHYFNQAAELAPDDGRVIDGSARCRTAIAEMQDRARMIDGLIGEAVDAYAAGNYREALSGFQRALEIDPENHIASEFEDKCRSTMASSMDALRARAKNLERRGDLPGAISSLERARALQPDNGGIARDIARLKALLRDREATRTAEEAREARATAPSATAPDIDDEALDRKYESGMKHLEDGRFADAARALAQVWAVAPTYRGVAQSLVRAYLLQGMADYSDGHYDEAIDAWQRVLTIEPGNSKSQRYLRKAREERSRLGGGSR